MGLFVSFGINFANFVFIVNLSLLTHDNIGTSIQRRDWVGGNNSVEIGEEANNSVEIGGRGVNK